MVEEDGNISRKERGEEDTEMVDQQFIFLEDVDECEQNSSICGYGFSCNNTIGNYTCTSMCY